MADEYPLNTVVPNPANGLSYARIRSDAQSFAQLSLLLPLVAALIHGLLYIFGAPPWQHYDEPGHFEYAWLIANRPELPVDGSYDLEMRREVAASMIEHKFYQIHHLTTPNLVQLAPIGIGISQIDGWNAYYWLVALPLRFMQGMDVTLQLYAARSVSLLLYLVTIVAGWAFVGELTPPTSPLRLMFPLTLAFIPSFADLMTSVNNDVGAIACASLLIWAIARLFKHSLTLKNVALVVVMALLASVMKSTAWPIVVMTPLALGLAKGSRRWHAAIWSMLALSAIAVFFYSVRFDDAALWYRTGYQVQGTLSNDRTLTVVAKEKYSGPALSQLVPDSALAELRGKIVTLGASMWASGNQRLSAFPVFLEPLQSGQPLPVVDVGGMPIRTAITMTIPANASQMWLTINFPEGSETGDVAHYDDIYLVEGDHASGIALLRDDQVVVDGRILKNFVRNPQLNEAQIHLKARPAKLLSSIMMVNPNTALAYFLDLPGTINAHQSISTVMFETAWARFGWGNVRLFEDKVYAWLALISLAGLTASTVLIWQRRKLINWNLAGLLALITLTVFVAAYVRGAETIFGAIWVPVARYAGTVIMPVVLLLCAGWLIIARVGVRMVSYYFPSVNYHALVSGAWLLYVFAWVVFAGYAFSCLVRAGGAFS